MKKLTILTVAFIIMSVLSFSKDNNSTIEVIYFHATMRCNGCMTIENYTQKSLNSNFGNEIKNGKILLKSIDFQQTENEHFAEKYKFDSQELILSKKVDGKEVKWKKLDKIWDYSDNYNKYQQYIKKEIKKFLK